MQTTVMLFKTSFPSWTVSEGGSKFVHHLSLASVLAGTSLTASAAVRNWALKAGIHFLLPGVISAEANGKSGTRSSMKYLTTLGLAVVLGRLACKGYTYMMESLLEAPLSSVAFTISSKRKAEEEIRVTPKKSPCRNKIASPSPSPSPPPSPFPSTSLTSNPTRLEQVLERPLGRYLIVEEQRLKDFTEQFNCAKCSTPVAVTHLNERAFLPQLSYSCLCDQTYLFRFGSKSHSCSLTNIHFFLSSQLLCPSPHFLQDPLKLLGVHVPDLSNSALRVPLKAAVNEVWEEELASRLSTHTNFRKPLRLMMDAQWDRPQRGDNRASFCVLTLIEWNDEEGGEHKIFHQVRHPFNILLPLPLPFNR